MALIKCPGCGNMVSNMASNCPKCGCPVSNTGYQNTNDDTRLIPQDNGTHVPYNNAPQEKKGNSNIWLYAVIALLSLALVGAGAYIFLNKDKGQGGSTTNTEVKNDDSDASVVTFKDEPQSPQASTQRERQSPEASPAKSNKVADGTYYLSGDITHKQNYYFNMEVKVRGNQARGQYIVTNGENVYVTLSGNIDADGNMKLTEYKNGQPTGYYFTGRFDESIYTGTYRCTNRKLVMNFTASTN